MTKPPAMQRALARATRVRYDALRDSRRKHIRALETWARESQEDHMESRIAFEQSLFLLQVRSDLTLYCQLAEVVTGAAK